MTSLKEAKSRIGVFRPIPLYRERFTDLLDEPSSRFEVHGYACGRCCIYYGPEDDSFDKAVDCCRVWTCKDCGSPCTQHWTRCHPCRVIKDKEADRERFRQAVKVNIESYDGAYYIEGIGYNDGYFFDYGEMVDHLQEAYEDEEIEELPVYAWTCHEEPFKGVTADQVCEWATEDCYEDAIEHLVDCEGLDKFLTEWTEKQPIGPSYTPNYKKAVLIQYAND